MPRIHGIELADQAWFPQILRDASMAFLRLGGEQAGHAEMIHPILETALRRSGESEIFDLCSGGGGQVLSLADELAARGRRVAVTLTDLRPHAGGRELAAASEGMVRYEPEAVDARNVSARYTGLRTILNGFHHFRPADAREILASSVRARKPIAVVEVARRSPWTALAILGTPLHVLLVVPWLRPFRWAWLPLTYLVPVVPFAIFWDAMFSCLRAYSRPELLDMTRAADPHGSFEWQIEEPRLFGPIRGISLVGIPRERLAGSGADARS